MTLYHVSARTADVPAQVEAASWKDLVVRLLADKIGGCVLARKHGTHDCVVLVLSPTGTGMVTDGYHWARNKKHDVWWVVEVDCGEFWSHGSDMSDSPEEFFANHDLGSRIESPSDDQKLIDMVLHCPRCKE